MERPASAKNRKKILWLLLLIGAVAAFCCLFALNYIPGGFTWKEKRLELADQKTLLLSGKELTLTAADDKFDEVLEAAKALTKKLEPDWEIVTK